MLIASTTASAAMGAGLESSEIIRTLARERGGRPEASVWFASGPKLPVSDAAQVNAVDFRCGGSARMPSTRYLDRDGGGGVDGAPSRWSVWGWSSVQIRSGYAKGAATDRLSLPPPRHISTLSSLPVPERGRQGLESAPPCRCPRAGLAPKPSSSAARRIADCMEYLPRGGGGAR
jgi:hypothetical protein